MGIEIGLFLLSAATLAFEIVLTRIFSVAQFYHFGFMIVSLALLGSGASGTFATLTPHLMQRARPRLLHKLGLGLAVAIVGAYLITLYAPFDSFRIAHDWRQGFVLILHYTALAVPFFCGGLAMALCLSWRPERIGRIYAANLFGSAVGCVIGVAAPAIVGAAGAVLVGSALAVLATCVFRIAARDGWRAVGTLAEVLIGVALVVLAGKPPSLLDLRLSPYKSLSYVLLYPDARLVYQRWNSFSRVDVIASGSIRSLPGSGFVCRDGPPPQLGLTVDGDDLSPITHVEPGIGAQSFTDCMLTALPYRLRPGGRALVPEPRGGIAVLTALSEGARHVTAVEPNPLVVDAVRSQGDWAGALYDDSRIVVVIEDPRAYVRSTSDRFDVVHLALTASQRPITSGAYSIQEDYRYTLEAFSDYVARLDDDGLLVISRWLQTPPSESVRAFALAVEALEQAGGDPRTDLVALRSYQQVLILARHGAFTAGEMTTIRAFAEQRAFDLVYGPDVHIADVNRYNVLPSPDYHTAFTGLVDAHSRDAWYRSYAFDVRPPTDDRPFFGHFFRWRQASEVLALAGHTWQPFGGAGYFVILALLGVAILAAAVSIVLPLIVKRRAPMGEASIIRPRLAYFGLLGLAFMLVEIPLMQRLILYLGHPTYAMGTVLFVLLFCSGWGSLLSNHVRPAAALGLLVGLIALYSLCLPLLVDATLSFPLPGRVAITLLTLGPLGLMMGMPFPGGLAVIERGDPASVSWAWAANGAASVVASVLAALLALSWGFSSVLLLGGACYVGACLIALLRFSDRSEYPHL